GDRVARHLAHVADRQDHEDEVRRWVGPRTDEIHVASNDVDELGQLIEPEPPEPLPDAGDPIAVVPLPLGPRAAHRIHGAELDQLEGFFVHPYALVDKEHGAAGVELDQERDQTEDGRQDDQTRHRHDQAQRSREHDLETRLLEIAREDDAAGRERLEGDLPGQALVGLDNVLDQDSPCPRLEEGVERQSPPSLGERDDDAIGPGRFEGAPEVRGVIHHTDDGVSEAGSPLELRDDVTRHGAPADDQHALADVTTAPDAMTQAQPEQEANDDKEARHDGAPAKRGLRD